MRDSFWTTGPKWLVIGSRYVALLYNVGSLPILSRNVSYLNEFSEAIDYKDMEEFVPSSLGSIGT